MVDPAVNVTSPLVSNALVAQTLEMTPPEAPASPEVIDIGGGYVELYVSQPLDTGGSPLVNLTVLVQSAVDSSVVIVNMSAQDNQTTVFGLNGSTMYRVSTVAINAALLVSPESTAINISTGLAQVPGPCPAPALINVTGKLVI